ncbi:MAG: hypothetical protein K2K70_12055 [Lachnospiraceae bacterium]|nr:hypothetical protein [Lachnospiraceae bacterium]
MEENIRLVKNFIETNKKYENSILISAPIFSGRDVDNIVRFFRHYGIRHQQNCVLFTNSPIINDICSNDIVGYPVFCIPEVCTWIGNLNSGINLDRSSLIHTDKLSEEEKKWVLELEDRKVSDDKGLSFAVTAEMYWYYKHIFSVIRPSKVIIWGGWKRRDYILAELAKKNNILYGFMEHGWIPGTYQFDRRGIAGQSEYAVDPDKILHLNNRSKTVNMRKIRNYIITNKIDTSKFRENREDERNLQHIDKRRKSVFLVGMDDYGMGINPKSDYWKKYVSSIFSSTQEAVLYIDEICRNNGWNLIFKPHPSPAYRNELSKEQLTESIIQIKHMEIDRLIRLCDVVVSISSAVEYKSLIYGKPLVLLGHTTLSKKGCSYDVESIDEVEHQLQSALEKGMTKEQDANFEQYMARLLDNYLWDDLSDRELRYGLSLETDFFDERE